MFKSRYYRFSLSKKTLTKWQSADQHLRRPDVSGRIGNKKLRLRSIGRHFTILVLKPALEITQITGLGDHFFFQWYGFDELVSDIHQEIHGVGFVTKVALKQGAGQEDKYSISSVIVLGSQYPTIG